MESASGTEDMEAQRLDAQLLSERFLEAVLDCSSDALILTDAQGRIMTWNPGAALLLGYGAKDVIGRNESVLGNHNPPVMADAMVVGDESRSYRHQDGRVVRVLSRSRELTDEAGQVMGTVRVLRPISGSPEPISDERERALTDALRALRKSHEELKITQLQLIQSAKLDSVGRLAAGVAHEVKNPLAILLTGIQLLQKRLPHADSEDLELLQVLEATVKRANGVVMGLLDFAAATALQLQPATLDDVVNEATRLVQHEIRKGQLSIRREGEVAVSLQIDRPKIEQVLLNLMMNAIDAMPRGGTLTVRTSVRQLKEPRYGVGFRKTDVLRVGQTVAMVEVEDTGPGLPEETLAKVFEPFFTTKPAGKGTGLGLAVCRMIAGLHRGTVWLENRTEGGTRAALCLPAGSSERGA